MQKKLRPLSVALLYYAGNNKDDEDTIEGVKGIEQSLKRTGHETQKIIVTKENWKQALTTPGDIIFNFVEDDTWELYESIAYGLERAGRAQVGHNAAGLKYAVKKSLVKLQMKKMHISSPKFKTFDSHSKTIEPDNLQFPIIIKPSNQHAGIGISQQSVVTNKKDLSIRVNEIIKQFQDQVIAEEFVIGREIHVTLLGNDKTVIVLPYCEIGFKGNSKQSWNVYTYDAKWAKKTWEYTGATIKVPTKITTKLSSEIHKLTLDAYRALRCCDIARFDLRVDQNEKPYIIDVNMNPSINYYDKEDATIASVYAQGWTYDQFIEKLLTITYTRTHKGYPKDKRLRK